MNFGKVTFYILSLYFVVTYYCDNIEPDDNAHIYIGAIGRRYNIIIL